MRAAGYGDRVYGRALTSGGKTWLQYWLFSYYNPQNVLGFGVHEGDWEFAGRPRRRPARRRHLRPARRRRAVRVESGAEVGRRAGRVRRPRPHASYFSSGVNPRGLYPDDYHRGTGYQVRPALEIVSQATPFMAW